MAAPAFVKRVVETCLRIQRNDRVTIFAWRHMLDLAEAFAIVCRRAGAWVHTEFGTDEMFYDQMNLPVDYLEKTNPFGFALVDVATANVFIILPKSSGLVKFAIFSLASLLLGIVTILASLNLNIRVLLKPMRLTSYQSPSGSMTVSPTLNGRSVSIKMPLKKLDSVS